MPNHLTVASRTTEIWLFEFREISTFGELWTVVIAFLQGNSKIGLRQAVDQVPYYHHPPSVLSSTQKWWRRQTQKCALMGNCRKFRSPVTLTLDQIKVISHTQYVKDYQPAQPRDCSIKHYRNMAIWISWNIDIRRSLNCRDSFPGRKFKNWALTSCSPGPILLSLTISFELHESGGGHRPSNVQLWAIVGSSNAPWPWPWPSIGVRSQQHTQYMCRTSSLPNHVTVASRTTEIWPFEFRQISTLDKLRTLMIAFLEGN